MWFDEDRRKEGWPGGPLCLTCVYAVGDTWACLEPFADLELPTQSCFSL